MEDINMDEQLLLSIPEVCEVLSVSEQTVRKYIRNSELVAVKLNRCYRVRNEDLNEFINKRMTVFKER